MKKGNMNYMKKGNMNYHGDHPKLLATITEVHYFYRCLDS